MKPPVFIAIKGEGGAVIGHVRADRIEAVFVAPVYLSALPTCSRIRTFSGCTLDTIESLDQVFAKMADALNLDEPSSW
jgi:hypothetical protein